MTDVSRLILVDGSSYLFRAFHALPPLTNSKGMNTGAAKGVIGMLKRLQADNPADQLVVIFDAKGPTFRNDIYSEYKANRPPMPEELREQIEPIHNVIRAMGLPLISISGVEADDVIGTLSVMAAAQRRHVLISTGDKDMAQLVNDYVTLVNTMTQTVLDRDGVIEKFGVPPELIIDLLALMGDSVDNIPGVAGVGEKTALALLQNLGGVSDIYTNLDRVPELPVRGAKSLGDKLLLSQEMAELSYVLATIKTDCDLALTDADLISSAPDSERLIELYRDLEFKAWLDELLSPGLFAEAAPEAVAVSKPELTTVTITQQSVLDEWISRLEDAPLFAFDTETTSLNYMQAEIVGVSFAVEPGEAAYVPLAHINPGLEGQLNREQVLEQLRPLLESDVIKKVGQHLKYDANVLANHGISLRGIAHDTYA
jgi:DNA polymerase-1